MAIPVIPALPDPPILGTDFDEEFSNKTDALYMAYGPWVDALNAAFGQLVGITTGYYSAASTSSLLISTGSKSFTIETGKAFAVGQPVLAASAADPSTHYMYGVVTGYAGTALTVSVSAVGSGVGATRADWNISLSGPIGPSSGTSLTNPVMTGTVIEDTYLIVDSASVAINPADGSIQRWTLGANRTPSITMVNGQSITLMINDGTDFAVNWATINPRWVGGSAPTLPTSGFAVIELWMNASLIYAAYVGNVT